jgi:predicted nucleic acid-binding Zn finger protein
MSQDTIHEENRENNSRRRKPSIYARAKVIAASRNIHKSSVSNIWLVESETVTGKFYVVKYDSMLDEMICDCPHFVFRGGLVCKHILSIALLKEESVEVVS